MNKEHLWITDGEVIELVNKPRGRSINVERDFKEHGSELVEGLNKIKENLTTNKTDSLAEENLIVFEINLNESEKLSNKNRIDELRKEGISVNFVKSRTKAIVSSTKKSFEALNKHVNIYKEYGKNKKFQYIDSFAEVEQKDKHSDLLRKILDDDNGEIEDVQLMILPNIDEYTRDRVINRLKQKISNRRIVNEYCLSDGTGILRAKLSSREIKSISKDSAICSVELTRKYVLEESSSRSTGSAQELDMSVNFEKLPLVCVLDDGIKFPDSFSPIIFDRWSTLINTPLCSHGTEVASKVVFKDLGDQIGSKLKARARIIDCPVFENNVDNTEDALIIRIKRAVEKYHSICKIYNLSINSVYPIDGDVMSIFGYELDNLSLKYNVKFVISSGNHGLDNGINTIEDILDDDDSRIAAPADSMLNISVGAVCGTDFKQAISKKDMVTSYSRVGPGPFGYTKPNVVAYGGVAVNGTKLNDKYATVLKSDGCPYIDAGTSFTAPQVAGDLAEVFAGISKKNILLAQTLLYHGAERLTTNDRYSVKDNYLFGKGITNTTKSLFSNESRVVFVRTGTINRLTKQRIKFYMPSNLNHEVFKGKIKVKITCLTDSPVDHTRGCDYLGAYLSASIHKLNIKNENVNAGIDKDVIVDKWDSMVEKEKTFSKFSSGDWEIWIDLLSRWDVKNDQSVNYALAITIESIDNNINIYDKIVSEAENRFVPLSRVSSKAAIKI